MKLKSVSFWIWQPHPWILLLQEQLLFTLCCCLVVMGGSVGPYKKWTQLKALTWLRGQTVLIWLLDISQDYYYKRSKPGFPLSFFQLWDIICLLLHLFLPLLSVIRQYTQETASLNPDLLFRLSLFPSLEDFSFEIRLSLDHQLPNDDTETYYKCLALAWLIPN